MIIGVTGFPNSGKVTVADYLVGKYKFTKISINKPMREILATLNPILNAGDNTYTRLNEALESIGYESTKEVFPEYRRLLQKLGKEASRDIFGEDFWIKMALERAKKFKNTVINDVRFANEATNIQGNGGYVYKIFRDGTEPTHIHASDIGVPDYMADRHIMNNSSIEDLHKLIDGYMKSISPHVYTR